MSARPFLLIVAAMPVLAAGVFSDSTKRHTVAHALTIVHPGDPQSRPIPVRLEQVFDAQGEPEGYGTWVDSVICRDKKCEVVKVRLHWDALGRYQRYEVEPGEQLTKLDHVPFSPGDHAKLQRILTDPGSPLREVTKEGLTGSKAGRGVDGVSGATVLTLKSNVVIGAGYTCYDLWHWANGEVAGIVRGLSGKAFSAGRLKGLLRSGEGEAVSFALVQLEQRKQFDAETVSAVVGSMAKAKDGLIGPALDFLRSALPDDEAYHGQLARIFSDGSEEKRVLMLKRLAAGKAVLPAGTLDRLSSAMPNFHSHHELHLFLNLVAARKAESETVSRNAAKLLGHRKFFVARRAYWYLEKQDLSTDLQAEVDAFRRKHQDRL